jgi:hypothetical protein
VIVYDWDKVRDTVGVNDVSESSCPTTCNLATNYSTNDNGYKNVKVIGVHVHVHAHRITTELKENISIGHNSLK